MSESLVEPGQMDASKRTWLIASSCVGAVGGIAAVVPFVSSFQPSEKAKAAGAAHTLFYKNGQTVDEVKALTQGQGVDVVIDMDFSTTAAWLAQGILKHHGQLIGCGICQQWPANKQLRFARMH